MKIQFVLASVVAVGLVACGSSTPAPATPDVNSTSATAPATPGAPATPATPTTPTVGGAAEGAACDPTAKCATGLVCDTGTATAAATAKGVCKKAK